MRSGILQATSCRQGKLTAACDAACESSCIPTTTPAALLSIGFQGWPIPVMKYGSEGSKSCSNSKTPSTKKKVSSSPYKIHLYSPLKAYSNKFCFSRLEQSVAEQGSACCVQIRLYMKTDLENMSMAGTPLRRAVRCCIIGCSNAP